MFIKFLYVFILLGDLMLATCGTYLLYAMPYWFIRILVLIVFIEWLRSGGISHWKPSNIKKVFSNWNETK